jgi:hypothetical protein
MREYLIDVDSKILAVEGGRESLEEALTSSDAELVRMEPPRFTVRVTASSESEAKARAVKALERWLAGPGAGWQADGVSQFG